MIPITPPLTLPHLQIISDVEEYAHFELLAPRWCWWWHRHHVTSAWFPHRVASLTSFAKHYERRFASHIIPVDNRPCLLPHSELVTRGGKAISGNYAKSHSNKISLSYSISNICRHLLLSPKYSESYRASIVNIARCDAAYLSVQLS